MQYLKRTCRTLCGLCLLALASWAFADGTDANVVVTNSVTINYSVNSVAQSDTTSVDFTVDRKLRLDVTTPQADWVSALPGQNQGAGTASSIQFNVTNNSNDSVDVVIALIDQALQQVDGFSAIGATAITPANITVWEDTNGDGVLDGGENTLGNSDGVYALTGTLLEDDVRTISVSIDVAGGTASDFYQAYTLVAAVASAGVVIGNDDSGNISPSGTPSDIADNKDTVQTVFADTFSGSTLGDDEGFDFLAGLPGPTNADDADFDGQASNAAGFRTRVALGIAKVVEVIWDPVSGNRYDGVGAVTAANPKAIPGALLLYVIGVNADAGLDASSVIITDDISDASVDPGNTTGEAPANINLPASISVTINGTPVNFTLAAGVLANGEYHTQDCAGGVLVSTTFAGSDPEINNANLGACDAAENGYVAYVVTVDDTP
ncbi:MAG: hypothetical protein AAF513_02200 [Pseudomonadota bacterium]